MQKQKCAVNEPADEGHRCSLGTDADVNEGKLRRTDDSSVSLPSRTLHLQVNSRNVDSKQHD